MTTAVDRKWFDLKPGMSVELGILDDGELNIEYDGPIQALMPRTKAAREGMDFGPRPFGPDGRRIGPERRWEPDRSEKPGVLKAAPESEEHERLVARIAERLRSDPKAMSLLEKITEMTKVLEHHKRVAKGGDPALSEYQKRLEHLQREYNERVQAISEGTGPQD